jgi:CRISPR-associated exonuclease Cas4
MSEDNPVYVRVVDLKHYLYCPRIAYFERVLGVTEQKSSQQVSSLSDHEKLEELEKRRKGGLFYSGELAEATKLFRVHLFSDRLNLEGVLDCVLILRNEVIPVDYKQMKSRNGRPWIDHKIQLAAYALLLEEKFSTVVRRGYLYYLPEERVLEVFFTRSMKRYVRRVIGQVLEILREERLPPVRVSPSKCLGCGYYWVCKRA